MSFTNEELEEWFKSFDIDGSGKIDVHELRTLVKSFYEWQSVEFDAAKVDADVGVSLSVTHKLQHCVGWA